MKLNDVLDERIIDMHVQAENKDEALTVLAQRLKAVSYTHLDVYKRQVESADIVLMKDSIEDVATAIRLSKAVIRNIKQNLFWAFFYNSIGIPIAAGILYPFFGILLSPVFAGAAMAFSSVSVVSNALRLRNFK